MNTFIPPEARARQLLQELKITQIPTPVEDICKSLNIECRYTDEIDAEALIIKGGKRKTPVIAVKTNGQFETRTRFSVAHELGHYCIPSHLNEIYRCSALDLHRYRGHKTAEKEANEFAAELLIPSSWIKQAIKHHDVTLQFIKTIASECETSLTSTALQIANYCSDRIAVVYSQSGNVAWYKKANAFNIYLDTGKLSKLSIASQLFKPGSLVLENKGDVPLNAWTNDDYEYEYLIEESLVMPYLNSILTILTIPYDEFEEGADDSFSPGPDKSY